MRMETIVQLRARHPDLRAPDAVEGEQAPLEFVYTQAVTRRMLRDFPDPVGLVEEVVRHCYHELGRYVDREYEALAGRWGVPVERHQERVLRQSIEARAAELGAAWRAAELERRQLALQPPEPWLVRPDGAMIPLDRSEDEQASLPAETMTCSNYSETSAPPLLEQMEAGMQSIREQQAADEEIRSDRLRPPQRAVEQRIPVDPLPSPEGSLVPDPETLGLLASMQALADNLLGMPDRSHGRAMRSLLQGMGATATENRGARVTRSRSEVQTRTSSLSKQWKTVPETKPPDDPKAVARAMFGPGAQFAADSWKEEMEKFSGPQLTAIPGYPKATPKTEGTPKHSDLEVPDGDDSGRDRGGGGRPGRLFDHPAGPLSRHILVSVPPPT
jgi:hypothetical protein